MACAASLLIALSSASASADCEAVQFGWALRPHFLIDPSYTNLNHGSFGAVARDVLAAQRAYVEQAEARPDVWFRATMHELINRTRADMAALMHANVDDVVLVENASGAINAVLRSLGLRPGDILIQLSTAYGMVKNLAAWLAAELGVRVVEVPIELPVEHALDTFVRPLERALREQLSAEERARVRLLTFSHLVSNPGLLAPVRELVGAARKLVPGARILIDGAHALGQVEVDMRVLGAGVDYYVSNGHKWLFAPKGSCVLWTARRSQQPASPEPTVISSANPRGTTYVQRFAYTGTRDMSALISLSDALRFRERVLGGERCVRAYVSGLARAAGDELERMWGTRRLSPPSMEAAMINVRLPTDDYDVAQVVQREMLSRHGVYMLALRDAASGLIYTRLSAAVYLELADFERAGRQVLELVEELQSRGHGLNGVSADGSALGHEQHTACQPAAGPDAAAASDK